jgi:hypothetical protein
MKKIMAVCLVAAMALAVGTANASPTWQTEPVLGTETMDVGDVLVNIGSTWVNIPHYVLDNGTQPIGMTEFNVGQTVDAGSGINVVYGNLYHWSVVYTGPSRTVTWESDYEATSPDNFVMNYLDPVSTLTQADVGWWNYTETWTDLTAGDASLVYSTKFQVINPVPAPGAILLASMGMGLVNWMRQRKAL